MIGSTFREARWIAKLIRRDTKNLLSRKARKAAKATKAVQLSELQRHMPEPKRAREPSILEHGSSMTARTSRSEDTRSTRPSSDASLYELLEGNLKELYASRDRDVSHEDRWQFRGSCLVLYDAIQACSSNPSYDIFRSQRPDESALICSLLQSARDLSTSSEMWRTIFDGTADASKTVTAATHLLAYMCPEMDADEVINYMGDPSKPADMHDSIVPRFREHLFPGYDGLVDACCKSTRPA